MSPASLFIRGRNKILRKTGEMAFRRTVQIRLERPVVSFTFDDFPRSALHNAGAILKQHGCAGSYYASAGRMGREEGDLFVAEDLERLLADGHELGCHTFHHYDAMFTSPWRFEASIAQNRRALQTIVPGAAVRTLAYPLSNPNAGVKRAAGRHSACCRGGGQTLNSGSADLNCLKGFFLEQSRDRPQAIFEMIRQNKDERGWLIFATHDVCEAPSPYGCVPELFEAIVEAALDSGARVLTVAQAYDLLAAQAQA